MPQMNNHCASCNAELQGPYCCQCGEQKLTAEQRRFGHLLSDLFQNLTNIDGKLIKTFYHLCLKPGLYEHNYHIGARNQYLKPISLFLLTNVLFVALISLNDFYLSFTDQQGQPYSRFIIGWVNEQVAQSGLSKDDFAQLYNQQVKILARSIFIIAVPFLFIFVVALFYDKRFFLADHFVFSLNLYAFWLLSMVLCWWGAYGVVVIAQLFDIQLSIYSVFGNASLLALVTYTYIAIGRMYQESTLRRLLKVPILLGVLLLSHLVYRFLQLVLTIWSM